jgi:AcrR family transcriptional regulator
MENTPSRRRLAEQRREQILDAALLVFSQKGFAGATIRDIAREVGITEGLLYHYFEGKDQLIQACWKERSFRPHFERILAESQGVSVAQVLREVFKSLLHTLYEHGSIVRLHLSEMQRDREMAADYRARNDDNERILCEFLRARQAAGEIRPDAKVEAAVRLLTSRVRSLILIWGQETPETWHAVVDEFLKEELDVILHGIAITAEDTSAGTQV